MAVAFLVYVCQHGPEETIHAAKGTTSPRYKAKMAAAARSGTPYSPPRYGTKEWFADLWTDSLEANTRWRRRRAADKAQARAVDPADLTPSPEPASPGRGGGTGRDPEPRGETQGEIDLPLDDPDQLGSRPGDDADASAANAESSTTPRPNHEPLDPTPTPTDDDRPLATVIPMFKKFNPKENDMSVDANPEVLGLIAAIAHARLCVDACKQLGTAEGEGFIQHLTGEDNGQATIDAASAMQEGFDNTLLEAAKLLAYLEGQLQVKEASDAVAGEHGSKEFMRQGE